MENNPPLFNLYIDGDTKAHLSETAKWARFLAIAGLVFNSLAVLGILFFAFYVTSLASSMEEGMGSNPFFSSGFGVGLAFFYILMLGIWFFPILSLLRFANRLKVALEGNDQQALNSSVQALKICFRFVGIVTVIILSSYAIGILVAIIGAIFF